MNRYDQGCRGGNGREGGNSQSLPVPASFVRADLVARLKREVLEGTYRIDTRAAATRMLPVLFPQGMSA